MNKNKEDIRNSFLIDKDKIIYFKDCSKELQLKIINEIIKIENKRIRLNKILKIISHVFLFMNVFIIVLSIYKNIFDTIYLYLCPFFSHSYKRYINKKNSELYLIF